MSYNPLTDFLALLRSTGGGMRSERMPGLDYVVSALARAGLVTVSVSQTAPIVDQATTVWFRPTLPSWTAEGVVFLWNSVTLQYETATPELWSELITLPFIGLIPLAGNAAPLMNGVSAVGVSTRYSRQDHVHPVDTSRAPLLSPVLTGSPQAPTATLGDSSTLIATTAFVIANGGLPPPIGSVLPYAGNTTPSASWQIAVGQAVSRVTFAALFAIVGITYGSGDGVTTFNLPDLRGRVVAGVDAGANRLTALTMSSQLLAGIGGAEQITLTTPQIPAHAHGVTDPGHTHSYLVAAAPTPQAGASTNCFTSLAGATTGSSATGISINNAGGGGAHNNVQPTIELQYLIRVA